MRGGRASTVSQSLCGAGQAFNMSGLIFLLLAACQGHLMQADNTPTNIRMIEVYDGSVRTVSAGDLPENKRFAFFRNRQLVSTRAEADEIVPVIEIRRLTTDDNGKLVDAAHATRVRIEEVGPGGRPLRWTNMLRRGR